MKFLKRLLALCCSALHWCGLRCSNRGKSRWFIDCTQCKKRQTIFHRKPVVWQRTLRTFCKQVVRYSTTKSTQVYCSNHTLGEPTNPMPARQKPKILGALPSYKVLLQRVTNHRKSNDHRVGENINRACDNGYVLVLNQADH